MHQSFLVVKTFFQRNHGLRSADAINIIDFKNDVFCVCGILRPNLTKDIKLARSDMGNGHVWDLIQTFQDKFGLMCFFKEYAHIGYKSISKLYIIQRE